MLFLANQNIFKLNLNNIEIIFFMRYFFIVIPQFLVIVIEKYYGNYYLIKSGHQSLPASARQTRHRARAQASDGPAEAADTARSGGGCAGAAASGARAAVASGAAARGVAVSAGAPGATEAACSVDGSALAGAAVAARYLRVQRPTRPARCPARS